MTAPAVAAGAVAKKWLRLTYGVEVRGYLAQIGPNKIEFKRWEDVHAALPEVVVVAPCGYDRQELASVLHPG